MSEIVFGCYKLGCGKKGVFKCQMCKRVAWCSEECRASIAHMCNTSNDYWSEEKNRTCVENVAKRWMDSPDIVAGTMCEYAKWLLQRPDEKDRAIVTVVLPIKDGLPALFRIDPVEEFKLGRKGPWGLLAEDLEEVQRQVRYRMPLKLVQLEIGDRFVSAFIIPSGEIIKKFVEEVPLEVSGYAREHPEPQSGGFQALGPSSPQTKAYIAVIDTLFRSTNQT